MNEKQEREMKSDPLYLIIREDRRKAGQNIGQLCMEVAYLFKKSTACKSKDKNVFSTALNKL